MRAKDPTHPDETTLLSLEARFCSHGDTVHYVTPPKNFTACQGGFLYDAAGTPYLDLQMQYSSANLGYRRSRLARILQNQVENLPQLDPQYLHRDEVTLAEGLITLTEERFGVRGRVHFNVGGAGAIEDSLAFIRRVTGKNLHFAFMSGYHGRTLEASSITSSYRYRHRYGHFGDRAQFIPYPYCYRCFYARHPDSCETYCLSQFKKLFDCEAYSVWDADAQKCEYGAFYIEPLQGTGGYVIPPTHYFAGLKEILSEKGILLVDDEIQMGFFRTGKLWAIEHFGIVPDVIVFGKALTNGLNPLSGIWVRENLIDPSAWPPDLSPVPLAGNPQGTAIAQEVLKIFGEQSFEEKVQEKGAYFLCHLRKLKRKYPGMIGEVDGLGLALRIEICGSDGQSPDPEMTHRLFHEGLKGDLGTGQQRYGLVLDVGGYYKNVFTLAPSLDISYGEIDLSLKLLDQLFGRFG
ncbi:MAG: aspartate aminotransferase family protein [Candidatus Binatia bacterium]